MNFLLEPLDQGVYNMPLNTDTKENSMFVKFPSIEHLRHLTKDLAHNNVNEITFTGKVKLHGTNAAIGYDRLTDTLWVQSRQRIITPEDDNYGFATWVYENVEHWLAAARFTADAFDADRLVIFGEWAGTGINQGAAICSLPSRHFFIIETYILDQESNFLSGPLQAYTPPIKNTPLAARVKHTVNYQLFSLSVDLQSLDSYEVFKTNVETLTLEVEDKCPVGAEFGILGIGEGIVWTSTCGRYRFKSKGPKHSTVDRKIKPSKDPDLEIRMNALISAVVTEARIRQAISEVTQDNPDTKDIGNLIKWVIADVLKEDSDTIIDFGFETKDFTKAAGSKLGKLFREVCDA